MRLLATRLIQNVWRRGGRSFIAPEARNVYRFWSRSLKGLNMILEVAILDVKPEISKEFEISFREASAIISSMPGYISHELQKCIETSSRYILLVQWETLEDHTIGFRQSEQYQEWKNLLHHYYDPFPRVEHYQPIIHQSRTGG